MFWYQPFKSYFGIKFRSYSGNIIESTLQKYQLFKIYLESTIQNLSWNQPFEIFWNQPSRKYIDYQIKFLETLLNWPSKIHCWIGINPSTNILESTIQQIFWNQPFKNIIGINPLKILLESTLQEIFWNQPSRNIMESTLQKYYGINPLENVWNKDFRKYYGINPSGNVL